MVVDFKPQKRAFRTSRVIRYSLAAIIVATIACVALSWFFGHFAWYVLVVFALLLAWAIYLIRIEFEKERYVFAKDKIHRYSGGFKQDAKSEVLIKNITNVRLEIPWIRHMLFKVGSVHIDTAGSAGSEVVFESVDNPRKVYDQVIDLMRKNGFKLSLSRKVNEDRPHVVGVVLDALQSGILGALFTGVFLVAPLVPLMSQTGSTSFSLAVGIGVLCTILLFAMFVYLRIMDGLRRKYVVFSDAIVYTEGFLTKRTAIIPLENVADAMVQRPLIKRLFGMSDVHVSCQGAGQEIIFTNMTQGEKLEQDIDKLTARNVSKVREASRLVSKESSNTVSKKTRRPFHSTRKQSKLTGQWRMNLARALLPGILMCLIGIVVWPLIPFGILAIVASLIPALTTTYTITPSSISKTKDFLSKSTSTFSIDKITGMVVSRSPLDRWRQTVSIQFWSIGASSDITFKHIDYDETFLQELHNTIGAAHGPSVFELRPAWSLSAFLLNKLGGSVVIILGLFMALIVSVVFLPLIGIVFFLIPVVMIVLLALLAAYDRALKHRTKVSIHDYHVEYSTGIWFRSTIITNYDSIKDIAITKYPSIDRAILTVNIAGERVVGEGKNKQNVSNHFSCDMIEHKDSLDEMFDDILLNGPKKSMLKKKYAQEVPKVIAPADPRPIVIIITVASIFFFPLVVFLPISLPLGYFIMRARRFEIFSNRLVAYSGVIFKTQTSILFKKIDHLSYREGILDKFFQVGNIAVNTAGSSSVEIWISFIKNPKAFYDALNKVYKKK